MDDSKSRQELPSNLDVAVRVRMYRVGFGDCFLVTFPGSRHILIDCGVHPDGDDGILASAVGNIAEVTGGKIAVVIATHAHRDHISGFGDFEKTFSTFEVSEVWMPWTENPVDPGAITVKGAQQAMTSALMDHVAASPLGADQTDQQRAAQSLLAMASGNDRALKMLKSGFKGAKARYLEAGGAIDAVGGIPGLSARIMGPPREDKLPGRMDPPSDQHFLGADGVEAADKGALKPFDKSWWVEPDATPHYAAIGNREKNLIAVAATNARVLPFALDDHLNNTSIVALFSYRGQHLLFPGDAQFGSWKNWIDKPDSKELLTKVTFLKVAHHGSLDGTPRSVVDAMTARGFAAMVSTSTKPFQSIPTASLMNALRDRASASIRSDAVPETVDGNFQKGEFWIDCLLPVPE